MKGHLDNKTAKRKFRNRRKANHRKGLKGW
jgi:hypothetical protein